jgi:lipopolysaccharide export system permease protein
MRILVELERRVDPGQVAEVFAVPCNGVACAQRLAPESVSEGGPERQSGGEWHNRGRGDSERMKILERHIAWAVLRGTGVAMLVLLPLVAFLMLGDELDNVGTGRYSLGHAFLFITLDLPRYAYQVFPIAALIGSLLGLGGMAVHSELTAMRSAGVSVATIVLAVLKAGMITALVAVLVGEVLAPATEEKARQLRAEALTDRIAFKSRYGFWARDGNSFINIRAILPGGRLRNVFIYEVDDKRYLRLSTYARFAEYTGDAWRLQDIAQSELSPGGVTTRGIRQAVWTSLLDPAMLSLLVVEPQALSAWGLQRYIRFMQENGLDATTYQVAFWNKVSTPLVILAMLYLSVPLLFGSLRSGGLGQRVFVGVLIGIVFYIINRGFGQLAVVYSLNPVIAAFTPALLCLLGASWFFRVVR